MGRKVDHRLQPVREKQPILEWPPVLTEVVRRIVAAYEPERVYLFASHARDEAGPDSDYDLLVVVSDSAPHADAERAAHRERLRQCLSDPASRTIEGFPMGDDEAILALSDPPYYTACPNPFLPEIVERWRAERAQLRAQLGLPDDSQDGGSHPLNALPVLFVKATAISLANKRQTIPPATCSYPLSSPSRYCYQ